MICCGKRSSGDVLGYKKNQEIEKKLKNDRKQTTIKILLLGTGDSGKTTFTKQMKILHKEGFTQSELEKYSEILRDNCLCSMNKLLFTCNEWMEIPKNYKTLVDLVMQATELTEPIASAIQELWDCDFVQKVFERNNEIHLPGGSAGTEYYIKQAHRFARKDFIPTQDDILRAKLRTSGIVELPFSVGSVDFLLIDVGGQRSERRKWLNCFVDISAVLFLVALNEYDMVLEEDNKTNRIEESLKLFTKITGAQWFENTPFVLFMNKSDLFDEKIKKKPLSEYFEDYDSFVNDLPKEKREHLNDVEKGSAYLQSHFVEAFNGNRLYSYVTCAIDTENCNRVFTAIKDSILHQLISKDGL
jgi:GTPase SAR1 family protein